MFALTTKVHVRLHVAIITAVLATGFSFPSGAAETSSDAKRTAFEIIDRNAEQIATATCSTTSASRECRNMRAQSI